MPRFKLIIVGNHRPGLRSVGEEMRRRIHLVEFPGSIPESERDPGMKEKLVAEYPAILQWMIDGVGVYLASGIKRPDVVVSAVDSYLQGEDVIGAWLEEMTDTESGRRELSGECYRNFAKWADAAGEYVPPQKRFVQRLLDRGYGRARDGRGRYIVGLRLRDSMLSM